MNFPNSPPKSSSSSYYATNNNGAKYSSHAGPYHPRLISTPLSSTHNHIQKNYHFSAKSSELFIKKKELISMPRSKNAELLRTLSGSTISFSSQHTPQSFIANKTKLKSKTKSKTRWKRERHKHSTWRRHRDRDESDHESRSRSRSRSKKQFESESESPSSSSGSSSTSIASQSHDHAQYTLQGNDIYCFYKPKHGQRRNYGKDDTLRTLYQPKQKEQKEDEDQNEVYNQDLNNSDCAIYESPFKKPKFMKRKKQFVSTQRIPSCVMRRINKINSNLWATRSKKRKQREAYIVTERSQSVHWGVVPSKCWFYRCVHMLEGHVLTMCSSPEFCGGVSYPKKLLDEIEKQLARIHPLPPLIYQRLFKTLGNLANLIKTYPNAVQWDSDKLQSVFENAIRKQQQMKTIYNFNTDSNQWIEYDFTPFKLPQIEIDNVTFHVHQHEQENEDHVHANDEAVPSTQWTQLNAQWTQLNCNQRSRDKTQQSDDELMMETPFDLNMDLVRKTKATLNSPLPCNSTTSKFVISPKIEQLVMANCAKINELKGNKTQNKAMNSKKKEMKSKEKEKDSCFEWCIQHIDSNDEMTDPWLKTKKETLQKILRNNGVHGPIKAMGLEPAHDAVPILYELPSSYRNLNDKRMPSMCYLISHYVDDNNAWCIQLLLQYFECMHDSFTSKQIRKCVVKHPKCIKRTFLGTDTMMCIVMQMYIEIENVEYYMRFKLNEKKRHKLLCTLLRIKNKHKRKRRNGMCIPQPPPPHNMICVNYNWNGFCHTTFCNKKHECSCCGDKHPARICRKQCVDYNWAKCHRICPKNKIHSCSQCRDSKHPAWRCPYLHKSVTERYYAIYKTKKIRNGYFKSMQRKQQKKNIEWINRKKWRANTANNAHPGHVNTVQTYHLRHHKAKKRKHV